MTSSHSRCDTNVASTVTEGNDKCISIESVLCLLFCYPGDSQSYNKLLQENKSPSDEFGYISKSASQSI